MFVKRGRGDKGTKIQKVEESREGVSVIERVK